MANLFEEAALPKLEGAIKVMKERGSQYSDTLRTCPWHWAIAVAREVGVELSKEQARAIGMAVMCDVKHERMAGGYKLDNIDDHINYAATIPEMIRLAQVELSAKYQVEVAIDRFLVEPEHDR